ncbi:peroxisomal biogenesis factor 11 [Xylaria nigripes]|nr:peroxisomal biogenesis factor 11 [Xylaria nigripes]
MSHTFKQFVRFTTDAVGLERTLRFLQATAQITASYTLPFQYLLLLHTTLTGTIPSAKAIHAILLALCNHLALVRRYFRIFRFLEFFHAAQTLYTSPSSGEIQTAVWLDIFTRTFMGMYLLIEVTTTVDALGIDGLAFWGPEKARSINIEAQRFWLFSLVCGALAGLVRVIGVLRGRDTKGKRGKAGKKAGKDGSGSGSDEKSGARTQEVPSKLWALGRGVVANALDVTLPGALVGWVPASSGTVGLAMFVTTVLTSMDVWERCGREVAGSAK